MKEWMNQTWWLYDLTVIAIAVLCIWGGWKRGLLRTVAGLLGYVSAGLLAGLLAQPAAAYVYDRWVEPACTQVVEQQLAKYQMSDSLRGLLSNYGIQLDTGLLEQVAAHLEERREIAVDVQVKAPEVRTVDVSVQVAARPGADFDTVRQAVESAVRGWFDGRLLGQSVLRAQLGALIFGVEGVENYALTAPAADVAAAVDELPQLGTLTVAALEGTA